MAALASITLYDAEESLTALLDSAELVTPEQEEAFLAEFEQALTTAVDKRDRVAGRLAKLEAQQTFAAAEIKRLQEYKQAKEAEQERLEKYITHVILHLGKDAKGKYRKLEGNSSSLSLRGCAPSVDVVDGVAIPLDYETATVTLPASAWNDILNVMPGLQRVVNLQPDKRAIKAAIEAGVEVPGARLITDKTTVVRK
jgi:hypothetical protein